MNKVCFLVVIAIVVAALIKTTKKPVPNNLPDSVSQTSISSVVSVKSKAPQLATQAQTPSTLMSLQPRNLRLATLLKLADQMEHLSGSTTDIDAATVKLSNEITLDDAEALTETALDESINHTARFLAVDMMSEHPKQFAKQLESIAKSEWQQLGQAIEPHSNDEQQHHFEETLRVQALAGLDQLNKQGNGEAEFFAQLETSGSPLLRKLARMGALGASQGQTLINQYIQTEL
jgi:hypothetical protein